MKTLFTIIGGAVVIAGGSAALYHFWYVPKYRRISYDKIDWLKKEINWKTHFASGTMNFDQLKTMPEMTLGVSKGNDILEMKRISDNAVKFTLSSNGKTLQVNEIDFVKQAIPA